MPGVVWVGILVAVVLESLLLVVVTMYTLSAMRSGDSETIFLNNKNTQSNETNIIDKANYIINFYEKRNLK